MSARDWVRGGAIAAGSFGAVSLALDRTSGEHFAVKSVSLKSSSPASIRSLENEIATLKSLASPHVVGYLGDDVTQEPRLGPCRNLHTEYMPGGTAARGRPMDEAEVRACTRCVALALRYLHGVAGVVHCDVKGRNVLLGGSPGVAKLADFGSAVRISEAPGGGEGERWFRGTPLWMAPEVVRGERPGPESDVWSLGCTVIEMASGRQPWTGFSPKDTAAALFKIGYGEELPEFPAGLSEIGRDFLDKCLRRKAEERWTAEQLLSHPFLAEFNAAAEWSPRSVLDWSRSEFADGDGEGSNMSCSSVPNSLGPLSCATERVKGLASEHASFSWNSDGWEVVRCAVEDLNSAKNIREEHCSEENHGERGEETYKGCFNRFSVELGDWNSEDVTYERSGAVSMDDGTSCHCCSCCCRSCFCCWCRGTFGCQDGVGKWLLLACCYLLCQLIAVCKVLLKGISLVSDWFPIYFHSNVTDANRFNSSVSLMMIQLSSSGFSDL